MKYLILNDMIQSITNLNVDMQCISHANKNYGDDMKTCTTKTTMQKHTHFAVM